MHADLPGKLKRRQLETAAEALERDALRTARRRLLPLLFLLYIVAFLDRVNVSFAALQMNHAIALSSAAYGFGAGVFYIGYALCEVPSNLILCRVGARRWIARIMLTWGLLSMAMMFVRGLGGWQWIFLLEGLSAVLLAPVVLAYLPDRPEEARWLTTEQGKWLGARIRQEQDDCSARHGVGLRAALVHPTVWLLGVYYFLGSAGYYGLTLWIPQIVRGFSGLGDFLVGVLSALPYLVAAVAMVIVSARSDRSGERIWYLVVPGYIAALGFVASAVVRSPVLGLLALTVAAAASLCRNGPFWALPSMFLTGTAAAGGIALINTVGALGGFAGPWVVGIVRGVTGSFTGGLMALAALTAASAVVALPLRSSRALARAAPQPGLLPATV